MGTTDRSSCAAERFWRQPELREWLGGARGVAVGASGGADSTALVWLMAWGDRPSWAPRDVVAAHVNHGLRGAASDADQKRVAALARELGVAFRYRRLDGGRLRAAARGSLEDAARRARYGALRDIVRRARCQALILAHHRDDLAETFLMRLLRGSGLTGLGGFGPVAEVAGMRVVRPLIDWSRDDVRAVAREAGLAWSEDATNRDVRIMRNRVRRRVLPYLERQTDHPSAARTLARTARRLEREGRALRVFVSEIYRAARRERKRPRRLGLPRAVLLAHDGVFAPYLLREMLCDLLETAYPPEEDRVRELEAFARSAKGGALLQTARNVVVWMSPEGVVWCYRKPRRRVERRRLVRIFEKP